jgi:ribosomal protein L37AE/L43A
LVFIEEYCCGEWRAKIKERKNSSHNTKRDVICPKCDYEYPRLYEDGHYKCDECGFVWVGQPSPIL